MKSAIIFIVNKNFGHLLGALICLQLLVHCGGGSEDRIETFTVHRGDFRFTVTETGELEAVNAISISAPIIPWNLGSLKITKLVEDGSEVKKDDILIEFDKAQVQQSMQNAQSELEIAQAELRKARASQKSQVQEMEADLEKARLQLRIAQLNYELAEHKSKIEQKKLELQLKNAEIDLDQAEEKMKDQVHINQQEINKLRLKVSQAQTSLEEAKSTIERLTIRAPSPGIAILSRNWSTGNKFQTDDQPWRGQQILRLPDLSLMQAKVMINEVDISKIDTTQQATITMDAYPDTGFKAHVINVAALARNKERDSKVKVFDVVMRLDEADEKLMPGMTVSCEVLVDQIEDTLFIPLDAVFKNENGPYVFLKKGSEFEICPIETGPENDNYVIVSHGLKEEDQVALVNPLGLEKMSSGSDTEKREKI